MAIFGRKSWLAVATLACVGIPGVSYAQDSDQFTSLMMQGLRQYKEGQNDPVQYEAAIESFKAARAINPIPEATYNIARAYHNLGRCEDALATYREYAGMSVENAETVKDYIAELSKKCGNTKGTLMLRCTPDSTKVSIDNDPAGYCLPEQMLATGAHYLVFSAEGYKTETRTVTVTADSRLATPVVVELQRDTATTSGSRRRSSATDETDVSGTEPTSATVATVGTATAGTVSEPVVQQPFVSNASNYQKSDFETVAPTKNVATCTNDGEFTNLFWAGVGLTGGGVLFSVIGGIILGNAYDPKEYYVGTGKNYNDTVSVYEKNDKKIAGGAAMLTIGSVASLAGIACFILDKVFARDNNGTTSSAVKLDPQVTFDGQTASAGFSLSF